MRKILQDNINARINIIILLPRELALALQNDEQLNDLLSCVTTAQGNMSNIH